MIEKVEPLIQRLANPKLPIHARIPIWLAVLKQLTRSGRDEIEAETLKTYTGLLAVEGFPASCFTVDSAEHVASLSEFFPAWLALKKALSDWKNNHPDQRRLAVNLSTSLSRRIEELTDGNAYFRNVRDQRSAARDDWSDPAKIRMSLNKIGDNHPMRNIILQMLAGLVRKHAPQNLSYMPPGYQ